MYEKIFFKNEKEYTKLFLELPKLVYKNDKNYIPEMQSEVANVLSEKHIFNRFLQKNIIILKEEKIVARAIFFINSDGDKNGDFFGTIGYFEAIDDAHGVKLLFDSATEFFTENGIKNVYGPMNANIWNSYRLMISGFENKPFYSEPYNKPYYQRLFEENGFAVEKTWESQYTQKVDITSGWFQKYNAMYEKFRSNKFSIRNSDDFNTDIKNIYEIIMESYSDFLLFNKLDLESFLYIYQDFKYIYDKNSTKLAINENGEAVGFVIALPDYGDSIRKFKGKSNVLKKIWFMLTKKTDRYILLHMGTKRNQNILVSLSMMMENFQYLDHINVGCIGAMMGDDTSTKNVSHQLIDSKNQYALMKKEIK